MEKHEPKYTPTAHIQWLLDGVVERENHYAETGEDIDRKRLYKRGEAEPTAALLSLWAAFERDVASTLGSWIALNPRLLPTNRTANEWVEEAMTFHDAAYVVFMTLNGEGVGVWDGRWDELIDSDEIDTSAKHHDVFDGLSKYLKERLGKYAHDCGTGSLNQAFETCAYKPRKARATKRAAR